jgi:hypothetical protein
MKSLRSAWRVGRAVCCAVAGWLVLCGVALAQGPKKEESADTGSYVVSYFLVLLAIGLGLLVICRPAGRRDRAKPEQYDEKGLMKEK